MGPRRPLTVILVGVVAAICCALVAASSFQFPSAAVAKPATAVGLFSMSAVFAALVVAAKRMAAPEGGILALLSSPSPHGKLARRVLVIVLIFAPLLGWLRFAAERAGLFGSAVGVAIMVASTVLTTTAIVFGGVAWLKRALDSSGELERMLATHRALFEGVVQQMPVGVVIAQAPSGRLIGCNRQANEITGDPTLGSGSIHDQHHDWKGFRPDGRQYATHEWPLARSVTKSAVVLNEEIRIERADGAERTIISSSAPVHDQSGAPIAAVVTLIDITDRKQIEKEHAALLQRTQEAVELAERANRIKDDFLAVLSHELRTPLNAILGWTHLLRRGHLTGPMVDEALATIEHNARAQAALVRDLLDVSGIIGGNLRLDSRPINPAEVVDAALENVAPAAVAKGIRIARIVDANAGMVKGDRQRLQQAVGNLLSNAVKFTPPGGVVEVILRQVDSVTEITVTDTGIGIPPDMLPHVFDRFRQGDSRATRAFEGVGLGLSIARDLVELHGGTIDAASRGEGRGATFTIRLPLQPACKGASEPSEAGRRVHLPIAHVV